MVIDRCWILLAAQRKCVLIKKHEVYSYIRRILCAVATADNLNKEIARDGKSFSFEVWPNLNPLQNTFLANLLEVAMNEMALCGGVWLKIKLTVSIAFLFYINRTQPVFPSREYLRMAYFVELLPQLNVSNARTASYCTFLPKAHLPKFAWTQNKKPLWRHRERQQRARHVGEDSHFAVNSDEEVLIEQPGGKCCL